MLNPKYQKYQARLEELIAEGQRLVGSAVETEWSGMRIENGTAVSAWVTMSEQIVNTVFGWKGAHAAAIRRLVEAPSDFQDQSVAAKLGGVLIAAKSDLEKGFLAGQEFIVASSVFGSVLEQAKHLNSNGYKDAAAVLMRVVVEDALKRLAREEGISDTLKASVINDQLKDKRYPTPQWRSVQAVLDVGNSAAHGNFTEYDQAIVAARIADVEQFLAYHFTA